MKVDFVYFKYRRFYSLAIIQVNHLGTTAVRQDARAQTVRSVSMAGAVAFRGCNLGLASPHMCHTASRIRIRSCIGQSPIYPRALNVDSPCKETLGAELVALAALGPGVRGVDGRVAVHVDAVLVGETVHAVSLRAAARKTESMAVGAQQWSYPVCFP